MLVEEDTLIKGLYKKKKKKYKNTNSFKSKSFLKRIKYM